jgi:cold shock CspA family protein
MKNQGVTCFGTIQKVHHLSARGFCFLVPDDGGADVFAHVRDFASPIGGVERGDSVSYVVTTDDRSGKPRARSSLAASAAWAHSRNRHRPYGPGGITPNGSPAGANAAASASLLSAS